MADNILARDLMIGGFAEIRSDATLAEALVLLIDQQARDDVPNVLIVLDAAGEYEGFLTARLLTRSLLALWMPEKAVREDESRLDQQLLDVVRDRLHLELHDALMRGLPVASPEDRLLTLIERGCDKRLEFISVIEAGRILGVVPITAIFQAASALALTPGDEGIRFDQPRG